MKIRSAAAAQKAQATQGVSQIGQADSNAGADLSLRQEFQAALENFAGNFAGRGVSQANLSQLALSTFDVAASTPPQSKDQQPDRPNASVLRAASSLTAAERDGADSPVVEAADNDVNAQHDNSQNNPSKDDLKSDDGASTDAKTVAAVESSASTVVAQLQSGSAAQNVAQPAGADKLVDSGVDTQATPSSPLGAPAALQANSAKPISGDLGNSGNQSPTGQNTDDAGISDATVEQTPAAKLDAAVAGAKDGSADANQANTDNSVIGAKLPTTQGFGAPAPTATFGAATSASDVSALALTAAINSTLTQRLASAVGSGQVANQSPTASAQQLGKSDGSLQSINNIRFDARGELSAKNELAKNAEQTARQARIQPSRLLERVESTLKEAAKSRDGKTISLRLDPPELGAVKVDVSIRDGSLHARVSAENSQVASVIREKAYELQSMLRKLGLAVEKVTVSVQDQKSGDGGDFSRAFSDTGNSRSQNQEKPRDFNNFTSGSSIALAEKNPLGALTPEGRRQLEINNGWVA